MMQSRRKKAFRSTVGWLLFYLLIVGILLVWVAPLVWVILSSFKPEQAILAPKVTLFFKPTLEHYIRIFGLDDFGGYIKNSLIVATTVTILSAILGYLVAYSLARFKMGGKAYSLWILSVRMMPGAVLIVPYFLLFRTLHLLDTLTALIMAYTTLNLPLIIWIMISFIEEIPRELEEAAQVDGASRIEALVRIILPLSRPGLVTCMIFGFIYAWNEYLFGVILSVSPSTMTAPVAVGNFLTGYATNWGPLFAAGSIVVLPVIILTLALQRHIVKGLTLGALK